MAGAGYKTFNAGDILTASDVQTYLQDQTVMVFASTTARDDALTAPTEGMMCWLQDSNRLQVYTGSAWLWWDTVAQTYTPTFTNFTLGNGTINHARYFKVGKLVHLVVDVSLGSTSSVTGQITMTFPSTAYGTAQNQGACEMTIGGTTYVGSLRGSSSTTFFLNALGVAGTYATRTATSATIPATWGSGSRFSVWTMYEEA